MTEVAVPVESPPAGRSIVEALPLLLAISVLMAGTGLTGTLLGVRAGLEGFGPMVTGVVLGGYYAGFLLGSLLTPSTLQRVGHVRVFAGLASLASAVVLIHVLRPAPAPWFLLRCTSGACIAGLYVVTETWLNGATTNQTRGVVLATYMVVVTGGLGVGQALFWIIDPNGFAAFAVASVLVSLAVVPISLARVAPPELPDPTPLSIREVVEAAPLAPLTAALSGFLGAAIIGGGTVYAVAAGLGRGGTAALVASALVGGLVLQVPIGRWSDRADRRWVIAAASAAGAVAAAIASAAGPEPPTVVIAATLVAGGVAFPLYSLASAHLNDYLDDGRVVSAGARMVMVNGLGAIGGPLVGAAAVQLVGPGALFVVMAAGYAVVAVFAVWRTTRRAPAAEEDRSAFVSVPAGAGATLWMLPEGTAEELYPVTQGTVGDDVVGPGAAIQFDESGTGSPLILLTHPDDDLARWSELLLALASDGLRVVVVGARSPDEVLALLRHLELPDAAFAATGAGLQLAVELAGSCPERVRALVAIGENTRELDVPSVAVGWLSDAEPATDDPGVLADRIVDFLRHGALALREPPGDRRWRSRDRN